MKVVLILLASVYLWLAGSDAKAVKISSGGFAYFPKIFLSVTLVILLICSTNPKPTVLSPNTVNNNFFKVYDTYARSLVKIRERLSQDIKISSGMLQRCKDAKMRSSRSRRTLLPSHFALWRAQLFFNEHTTIPRSVEFYWILATCDSLR